MKTVVEVRPTMPIRVSLVAADGYLLNAQLYKCDGEVRARIIVAGATGVPQTFY